MEFLMFSCKRLWTVPFGIRFFGLCRNSIEFYLNVFTEFSDKNVCHHSKRVRTCHPATSCVRDQDVTTVPARYMWKTGSLNWNQFMLQLFIRFPGFAEFSEILLHLRNTAIWTTRWMSQESEVVFVQCNWTLFNVCLLDAQVTLRY